MIKVRTGITGVVLATIILLGGCGKEPVEQASLVKETIEEVNTNFDKVGMTLGSLSEEEFKTGYAEWKRELSDGVELFKLSLEKLESNKTYINDTEIEKSLESALDHYKIVAENIEEVYQDMDVDGIVQLVEHVQQGSISMDEVYNSLE